MEDEQLEIQLIQRHDTFLYLTVGLRGYQQNKQAAIPAALRKALNTLALRSNATFPKTLYGFLALCHTPLKRWYPLDPPDTFDTTQPLLYDNQLSEEAESFLWAWLEQDETSLPDLSEVSQWELDGRLMLDFRQRLRELSDVQAAQTRYVQVRSFLIEQSCATSDQLRACSRDVFQELRLFFDRQPDLPVDTLLVCDRCGLLDYRNGAWHGVKPDYCSDHADDSPYIHAIPKKSGLHRLKRQVHQRVFIPGRLELALFQFAEAKQDEYPDHLIRVERYPGLDTYDLRLTFQSGDMQEVWAIDAKDHAHPRRLAQQIRPMYGERALAHDQGFYVIPDERFNDEAYRLHLECEIGLLPPKLHLLTLSAFKQQVTDKLMGLARPPRRRNRR